MSDINGAITQAAAPGALLRTAAEAQAQDPTKSQQPAAQPSSPIRSLTQNPIESTIPSTTPRVLNAVPVQQPNPDFTGLHAMLSSAPVPPPHVAASLIRAMMTPPSGGNGGVIAARPYVPQAPTGNAPGGNPSQTSGQPNNPSGPSQANAGVARPGGVITGGLSAPNISGAQFGPSRPTASASMVPHTQQNTLGVSPFLGGTVDNIAKGAGEVGTDVADLGAHALSTVSPFLRALAPAANILGGFDLSNFITNRLGLGDFLHPKSAS